MLELESMSYSPKTIMFWFFFLSVSVSFTLAPSFLLVLLLFFVVLWFFLENIKVEQGPRARLIFLRNLIRDVVGCILQAAVPSRLLSTLYFFLPLTLSLSLLHTLLHPLPLPSFPDYGILLRSSHSTLTHTTKQKQLPQRSSLLLRCLRLDLYF